MPQSIIKTGHAIDWNNTKWVEKEKRTIPCKLVEGSYIKNNKNKYMSLNDGLYASAQYGVGEKA